MSAPIVGRTLTRLLQTPATSAGVWIKEFGEAYLIKLIAELDDGRFIRISEYMWKTWDNGCSAELFAAELTQDDYCLTDIVGQRIEALRDSRGDFAIVFENGLALACPSGPGGNYPWIYPQDLAPERE